MTELSVSQLLDAGIAAYKIGDIKASVTHLLEACDRDQRNWMARLYLGMAYYKGGDIFLATRQFRFLQDNCTDQEVRQKALSALSGINALSKSQQMQKTSGSLPKPKQEPQLMPVEEPAIESDQIEIVSSGEYYKSADEITARLRKRK